MFPTADAQGQASQPTFIPEQRAITSYYDNCMGQCHYAQTVDPVPGMPVGGPRPETPTVDRFSGAMADLYQQTEALVGTVAGGAAALRSAARGPAQTIDDILRPGGQLLGAPGDGRNVRVMPGGETEASDFFTNLSSVGRGVDITSSTTIGDGGAVVRLPNGGTISYRPISKSGPPTVGVTLPGYDDLRKIKFK